MCFETDFTQTWQHRERRKSGLQWKDFQTVNVTAPAAATATSTAKMAHSASAKDRASASHHRQRRRQLIIKLAEDDTIAKESDSDSTYDSFNEHETGKQNDKPMSQSTK